MALGWTSAEIRRLLKLINRGSDLDRISGATELRHALGASTAREALLSLINSTFDNLVERERLQHAIIIQCDVKMQKVAKVVKDLHISRRALFRLRGAAMAAIADAANARLQACETAEQSLVVRLASAVRRFDPALATKLFKLVPDELCEQSAYEALCAALCAQEPIDQTVPAGCVGSHDSIAQLQFAHDDFVGGRLNDAGRRKTLVASCVGARPDRGYERVAFELAFLDHLDGERRCDARAMNDAIQRMVSAAGNDKYHVGLALVTQGERATHELDMQAALLFLRRLQTFPTAGVGSRLLAHVAYATASICFMLHDFESILDLASSAYTLVQHTDAGLALRANSLAGRIALASQHEWRPCTGLAERYRHGWIAGLLRCVQARHLTASDPEKALVMSNEAAEVCAAQQAPAAFAYALASQAIALCALGDGRGPDLLFQSWKRGIALAARATLVDQVVHRALPEREFGPFLLDDAFFGAVNRYVLRRGVYQGVRPTEWLEPVVRAAVGFGASEADELELPPRGQTAASLATRLIDGSQGDQRSAFLAEVRSLAWTLSTCLPFNRRALFEHRFVTAFCAMIPPLIAPRPASKIA